LATRASGIDELRELKKALLSEEQQRLEHLEQQVLNEKVFSGNVAAVLADALQLAARQSGGVATALQEPLIEATATAARREPLRLTEALAPVIGATIRRSIVDTLRAFLHSIETVAAHAFSIRGLRWRWEAIRAGVPFEKVALKYLLRYDVEQLYLIHRPSGLLLLHMDRAETEQSAVDKDAVAAMVTAIQQFAKDAVFADGGDAIQTIEMGERTLWLGTGEGMTLACLINGTPPQSLRTEICSALDELHSRYHERLVCFQGDLAHLPDLTPILRPLLRRELHNAAMEESADPWIRWTLFGTSGLILLIGALHLYTEQRTLARLERALRATPGVLVTAIQKEDARYVVHGMADPLAYNQASLEQQSGLQTGQLRLQFTPYVSLDPKLVLQRTRAILAPPDSVEVSVRQDTLVLTGTAPHAWKQRAETIAPSLQYFTSVDTTALNDREAQSVAARTAQINATQIFFSENAEPLPDSEDKLAQLVTALRVLSVDAQALGMGLRLLVVGYTDGVGTDLFNQRLRDRRIAWALERLKAMGVEDLAVESQSVAAPGAALDRQRRRVDFKVAAVPFMGTRVK
jgi:OOP family OmpA-OmpF porin